jgi:hypothetical protein
MTSFGVRRTAACAAAIVLFVCLPGRAAAAPWTDIPVPGGLAAFRCIADVPAHVSDERALYDVARAHAESVDESAALVRILEYFAWLAAVEETRGGAGGTTLTLQQAAHGDTVSLLGLRRRTSRGRLTIEVPERARPEIEDRLKCLGLERRALATALQANQTVAILPPDGRAPWPLPAALWERVFERRGGPRSAIRDMLARQGLRRLHVGLSALDGATLEFLHTQPRLIEKLAGDDLAGPFAAFSAALRIAGNRVDPPGGSEHAAIWSRAIGRQVTDPAAFAEQLFRESDGKLACLYAAIDALDAPARATLVADASGRPSAEALNDLLDAVKASSVEWVVRIRPFSRPAFQAAAVLSRITVEGGRLGVPAGREFWEKAFEVSSMPSGSDRVLRREGDPLTASQLIKRIFDNPATSRERFETFRFTQRYVARRPGLTAVDLIEVPVAARLFPALARALERAGITDPALYVAAARRAQSFADVTEDARPIAMRHWQGAIAIVEALRRTRAIDPAAAEALLTELLRHAPVDERAPSALYRAHLDRTLALLPSPDAPAGLDPHRAIEWRLLHAMTAPKAGDGAAVLWDGVTYRVNVVASQAARALAIARLQPRATLDDILTMGAAARALGSAKTLAEVVPHREALAAISGRLAGVALPTRDPEKPWRPAQTLSRVMNDLSRVRRDRDTKRARNAAEPLEMMASQLLADAVPALVYAARLGAAVAPPEQFAELWRRHDLGLDSVDENVRRTQPWTTPVADASAESRSHIAGSLLGVDIALGGSLARGLAALQAGAADGLLEIDRRAIAESIAVWIAAADEPVPPPPPALAPTPLESHLAAWVAAHGGAAAPVEPASAARFLSGVSPENCWCAEDARTGGRHTMTAVTLVERGSLMPARIHALLETLGMPPALAPLLGAYAWSDVIGGARPMHTDDWAAVRAVLDGLTRDRLEEMLFALVATGELSTGSAGR